LAFCAEGGGWQQLKVLPQASEITERSSLSPYACELLPHSVLLSPNVKATHPFEKMQGCRVLVVAVTAAW